MSTVAAGVNGHTPVGRQSAKYQHGILFPGWLFEVCVFLTAAFHERSEAQRTNWLAHSGL